MLSIKRSNLIILIILQLINKSVKSICQVLGSVGLCPVKVINLVLKQSNLSIIVSINGGLVLVMHSCQCVSPVIGQSANVVCSLSVS